MGKLDLSQFFSIKRTIGASHMDAENRLRLSVIVDFLQDCEGFQLDSLPNLREFLGENNMGIFLTSRQIDINRLPDYGEELRICTFVYENKNFYGCRNTIITDENGEDCICAYASGAFVNLETLKPQRLPENIFQICERYDMEYLPRKIALSGDETKSLGELKIPKYFIDAYNHVNNARYIDVAQEFLNLDKLNVKRFRAEYKNPAVLGDLITVYGRESEGALIAELRAGDKVSAVIEFTI